MREILFKAKAINRDKGYHRTEYKNGDWVFGNIHDKKLEDFENGCKRKDFKNYGVMP